MLIKSVKLINHPGVGDVFLDFTDDSGNIFKTIVIAGENGTGKTAIIEAIQTTLEHSIGGNIGIIELEIKFDPSEFDKIRGSVGGTRFDPSSDTIFLFRFDSENTSNWHEAYKIRWAAPDGSMVEGSTPLLPNEPWNMIFKSFYNEASVNFSSGGLSTITGSTLDREIRAPIRSGANLAREITQLIADIRAQDAEDIQVWVENNPGSPVPNNIKEIRISRFKKSFNYMFPSKKFLTVKRDREAITVEFEDKGRISSIDKLSTGEKQIVFRAGFLLRDLSKTTSSIILIDEPELSLHPDWQEKIMSLYELVLSDSTGAHPQIIVATHSPFIVHGAPNAKIIVLKKDHSSGQIFEMPSPVYPIVRGTEAIRAFNLDAFLSVSQKQLLVLTEGETDASIFTTAWDKLRPNQPIPIEFRSALGAKNINITLNDSELFNKIGSRYIAGVFDFDDAFNHWKGVWGGRVHSATVLPGTEATCIVKKHGANPGWAILLPVPSFRSTYASMQLRGSSILSVEFLFEDSDFPANSIGYNELPLGQREPYIFSSIKTRFAEHVKSLDASKFVHFEPLLARFEAILAGQL